MPKHAALRAYQLITWSLVLLDLTPSQHHFNPVGISLLDLYPPCQQVCPHIILIHFNLLGRLKDMRISQPTFLLYHHLLSLQPKTPSQPLPQLLLLFFGTAHLGWIDSRIFTQNTNSLLPLFNNKPQQVQQTYRQHNKELTSWSCNWQTLRARHVVM